jgi:hypothetical protein
MFFAITLILFMMVFCARSDNQPSYEAKQRYRGEATGKRFKPLVGGHYERMASRESIIYSTDQLKGRQPCNDGQLTFESDVSGRVYKSQQTGHFLYEPDACILRRLDAAEVRTCLAGKRIVWMGDSVMRYQALSLIAFLASGGYQNPYDDGGSIEPSISNVNHWPGRFSGYYSGAVKFLKGLMGRQGTAECIKCSKQKAEENWYATFTAEPISLDFKYLYRYPSFAKVGVNGLNWAVAPGFKEPSGDHSRALRKQTEPKDRPPPNFIIFNMCTWWHSSNMTGLLVEMEQIFAHGEKLASDARASGGDLQLVWRSCLDLRFTSVAPQLDEMARDHGWLVYNLRPVLEATERQKIHWRWNGTSVHWIQLGYETFNDILLSILCK